MARFIKGDIVVVPFPFSEAAGSKPRPALVLAVISYAHRSDYLVCAITSQAAPDPDIMTIDEADVLGGSLKRRSYLRPTYLYTTGEAQISRKVGTLAPARQKTAIDTLVRVITR